MSSSVNSENQEPFDRLLESKENKGNSDNVKTTEDDTDGDDNHNGNDNLDSKCNFFGWSPDWLQSLASKKSYVIFYGLLGLNQAALSAYFIGTISTIEKRFKMPSTHTGIIITAWDVGSMGALMLMAYFGSAGHKTRWVAGGALLSALSCYVRYIPHILFGPGEDFINYSPNVTTSNLNVCNETGIATENCSLNSEGMITFFILAGAQFAIGIGASAYYTLGAAYLDDNALKNKFPILFAAVGFLRYFGPTLGFLLSSYTLSIFIDPNENPPFGQDDPRWIGAWHLGWLVFGTSQMILAVVMAFFPKILPREAIRRKITGYKDNSKVRSFADFKKTLSRLMKNPILVFNTFSTTFYVFGLTGYWIFMPKYIETQFRKSASSASLITGSVGLVCTAVGIVASGSIISKFKPRATYLAAWNVFTESIDVLGHFAFAFLGCLRDDLHGSYNIDGSWNLTHSCNIDCDCSSSVKYSPVCSMDKSTTFYSPCHAGCTTYSIFNNTKIFENCSCIENMAQATDGACPIDCENNFTWFLVLLCLMKFLSSTGRAGNTVIQLRAVLPDDKSVSIAITEIVLCIFTFIPAPVMFGWLLDSSCLVWGMICGKTGNCWLYDGKKLRYLLNFTASGFLFLAVLLDVAVLWKVGNLKIYDEDMDPSPVEKDKNTNDKDQEPFTNKNKFCSTLSN